MEYFVLGLLMLYKYTAYELHVVIKKNYQGICSDSIGNIQRALKKLAANELVTSVSIVENEVNKKIYTITPKGRQAFLEWLDNSIDIMKSKNMELSRLLLLGFLDDETQMKRIDETIAEIEEAHEYLVEIERNVVQGLKNLSKIEAQDFVDFYLAQFNKRGDDKFLEELIESVPRENLKDIVDKINIFGTFTLKLGIDETKFYLNWFKNLKKTLEEEKMSQ